MIAAVLKTLFVCGCLSFLILFPAVSLFTENDFRDFENFLTQYQKAALQDRHEIAASFVKFQQARGGFPILEADGNVLFLFLGNGNEKDVRVIGDFRPRNFYNVYWDETGESMSRAVGDSPLFYKRMKFEKDARIDYKFFIDGKYVLDPLNSRIIESGTAPVAPNESIAQVSELRMPEYKVPELVAERPDIPQGKLIELQEQWANPKITIYLPAEYSAAKRYPVLYTADGSAWNRFVKLPQILNHFIFDRKIEPAIAVMIDSIQDRRTWYYYNPQYLSYLEKVIEYIDTHYSTRARPEERVHAGSSAGGSITLYVGFERPNLIRNLAMLSPSLTGPPHYYEPYFSGKKHPDPKLKIWLSAGKYESYIHQDALTMESYFKRAGLTPKMFYTHEGHSFGAWRRAAQEMLLYFFGQSK